jgi:hypothetical protein
MAASRQTARCFSVLRAGSKSNPSERMEIEATGRSDHFPGASGRIKLVARLGANKVDGHWPRPHCSRSACDLPAKWLRVHIPLRNRYRDACVVSPIELTAQLCPALHMQWTCGTNLVSRINQHQRVKVWLCAPGRTIGGRMQKTFTLPRCTTATDKVFRVPCRQHW